MDERRTALILLALYIAFLARVLAQLLVAAGQAPWLPPFEQWQSGLLPYPLLVACQVAILIGFARLIHGIRTKDRFIVENCGRFAAGIKLAAIFYFLLMACRYAVFHVFLPDMAQLAPLIPTLFHFDLAAFIFIVGKFAELKLASENKN